MSILRDIEAKSGEKKKKGQWWRRWFKKDTIHLRGRLSREGSKKSEKRAASSFADRPSPIASTGIPSNVPSKRPTHGGTAPTRYNFEDDVSPFIALLALDSVISKRSLPPGEGDALSDMWRNALRTWYEGDRTSAFPQLELLLSRLSQFDMSTAPVAGLVNHQYGMQLRAIEQTEEPLAFLRRAKQNYLDWIDRHEAQLSNNIVISAFGNYLFSLADAALGQLAHECIAKERYLEALDCAEKGLQIAQRDKSATGELLHTVNLAFAQYNLGETESAREVYEQALILAHHRPGNSEHDIERFAFACWQLGKLAYQLGETNQGRELFSAADHISSFWIEPDMVPYFQQFRTEVAR